VLIAPIAADERLTTTHRAKLAYVCVRQSSLNQVRQHRLFHREGHEHVLPEPALGELFQIGQLS
jgi:hypothetical protein